MSATVPLDEQMAEAIIAMGLDESDAWTAVKAVSILIREHSAAEYGRGVEYGDQQARRAIGHRIGVLR